MNELCRLRQSADCQKTSLRTSLTEQRGKCEGAQRPLRVQSTRILLFQKFENTHSVAKRLFRHAEAEEIPPPFCLFVDSLFNCLHNFYLQDRHQGQPNDDQPLCAIQQGQLERALQCRDKQDARHQKGGHHERKD